MDTHTDYFIEQRPGLMQPIIRRAVSRREGPTALFATETSSSALRGDVEGMSNDVAFAGLASQGAIGVWTAARSSSAPLHTCLLPEKPEKIQLAQQIAGLLDTVNNTCLKKHQGVAQDYVQARNWFLKAAEQGHEAARYNLGVLYHNGQGVPQDYSMAYVWYDIAAAQGEADAEKNRDAVAAQLDPASLAEAQKLSKEYFKRYVEPFR